MVIWQVKSSIDYHYLGLINWEDGKSLFLAGQPHLDSWRPLPVEIVRIEGKAMSDFPVFSGGNLTCGQRALEIIAPFISKYVEFLPLQCNAGPFYLINVIAVIDCLDHTRSQFEYFRDGDIKFITLYEFKPSCVGDIPIFKIPERRGGPIFCSDTFKQRIEDNQLQGLIFHKVWEG